MKRVLIVDDEPHLLRIFSGKLRDLGYEVHTALGGREGVNRAEALHPDLVLMDMNMPDMDGREATRLLKAGPLAETTIIALTALSMPDEIEEALAAGCDGYVVKPLQPDELVGDLRNVLDMLAED